MILGDHALRVVITDDEAPARSRLQDLLSDCAANIALHVVGEATNGRELLELLGETPADVVLLDIRMPDMDGVEAARHLQKFDKPPAIIFTTAYDGYAVQAFELHAVDYLLKPIRAQRLEEALARIRPPKPLDPEILRQMAHEPRRHLSVQERGRVILVAVNRIVYLRAELKYLTIRTAEREFLLEESLVRLEEEFGSRFVRIHRGCLVAREYIEGFERAGEDSAEGQWLVVLRGIEEKLPISRRQQHIVKELSRK